jgi:hypothetical protein
MVANGQQQGDWSWPNPEQKEAKESLFEFSRAQKGRSSRYAFSHNHMSDMQVGKLLRIIIIIIIMLQLESILKLHLRDKDLKCDTSVIETAVDSLRAQAGFSNARAVENILQQALRNKLVRRGDQLTSDVSTSELVFCQ